MNPYIEAKNASRKIANQIIQQSFCKEHFDDEFLKEMQLLVCDDVHLNEAEIKKRNWVSIYSDNNDGAMDIESQGLIDWWDEQKISPIYATSRQRLFEHTDNQVLVMRLTQIDTCVLNQIDLGMWTFGEISSLANQRISDWRADIWFSKPLRFIVISEHGGYGTTTIAGPAELLEKIQAKTTHDEYEWKPGVVPDWNKGAAFPETSIPPEDRNGKVGPI